MATRKVWGSYLYLGLPLDLYISLCLGWSLDRRDTCPGPRIWAL